MSSYLCFEGIQGSGKSQLAEYVGLDLVAADKLLCHVTFPSNLSPVGKLIREYLRGDRILQNPKALLYLYAADGHLVNPWIRGHLARGHYVVADRHPIHSGRVHQLEHHPAEHIEKVYGMTELQVPDYLFVVDVPAGVAIDRMRSRSKYQAKLFETQEEDKMEEFRRRYLALAEVAVVNGWAQHCHVLDGTLSSDELTDQVFAHAGIR